MKTKKVLGLAVFAAMVFSAALLFTTCDDGAGGGGGVPQTSTYTGVVGGTSYTLNITENTGRYTVKREDAYELTAGSKKSSGTVMGSNDTRGSGVLRLKPSNTSITFVAGVSGSAITLITGTITWTDYTTDTFSDGNDEGTTPSEPTAWTIAGNNILGTYYYDGAAYGNPIRAIAYGNGKFVVGGDGGKMAYSYDGVTWTDVADSRFGTRQIIAIAYGSGKFVAGGQGGTTAYSLDGINWTAAGYVILGTYIDNNNGNTYRQNVRAIAYGGGRFVVVGYDGKMAYSSDGITWTAVADSTFTNQISAIAYGNGKFVAGSLYYDDGMGMAYSYDGVNWTGLLPESRHGTLSMAYGNGRFVVVHHFGTILYDGVNWTDGENGTLLSNTYAIAYGNGKFVAGNTSGEMAYSSDGINWTAVADSKFGREDYDGISAIAYGNGKFVAVGYSGKIAYSSGE